jgi:hypothetical protein
MLICRICRRNKELEGKGERGKEGGKRGSFRNGYTLSRNLDLLLRRRLGLLGQFDLEQTVLELCSDVLGPRASGNADGPGEGPPLALLDLGPALFVLFVLLRRARDGQAVVVEAYAYVFLSETG